MLIVIIDIDNIIINTCLVSSRRKLSTGADEVDADLEIIFHKNSITSELPQNAVVVETLVAAVNNSTFNVTIDTSTIKVTCK